MVHQLISYIAHLFKSFHLHGIHSPFVFQLEKKCLNDTTNYQCYVKLSRFRESVTHNNQYLTNEGQHTSNKFFKCDYRKISNLLKPRKSAIKNVQLLYRLCNYFKVNHALVLGTSLGIDTYAMAVARSRAQIIAIEGDRKIYDFAIENFLKTGLKNVHFINDTFKEFLVNQKNNHVYDMVLIDGRHNGTATSLYFKELLKLVHKNSVIIITDIYSSKDITTAWNQICQHPQVTASINCFHLGIVFLREELSQQKFYVRLLN